MKTPEDAKKQASGDAVRPSARVKALPPLTPARQRAIGDTVRAYESVHATAMEIDAALAAGPPSEPLLDILLRLYFAGFAAGARRP